MDNQDKEEGDADEDFTPCDWCEGNPTNCGCYDTDEENTEC